MKKCLIVVDYQNDFTTGSLGCPQAKALEHSLAARIAQCRSEGWDIIFTLDTHRSDYLSTQEGKNLPVEHCISGTEGHGLYGEVASAVRDGDRLFYKNTFGSDELYEYLKFNPYESIELCGVVTNICVISNAVLAKTAQPETPIYVNSSLIASNDDALGQAALNVMKTLQINIVEEGK